MNFLQAKGAITRASTHKELQEMLVRINAFAHQSKYTEEQLDEFCVLASKRSDELGNQVRDNVARQEEGIKKIIDIVKRGGTIW